MDAFRQQDLRGAQFFQVHLNDARFEEVDLSGARFHNVYLTGTTIRAEIERLWAGTVDRARELPAELLHERVDGEWSFIQTLRHLVFVTDAWVRRAYLGEESPYSPLGLPHTETDPALEVPNDPDARPTLAEVLALRADRMATVRQVLEEVTDERLAGRPEPVPGPGYPPPDSYAVSRCLGAILNEEWEHRRFAERDLDVLRAGMSSEDAPQ